MTWRNTTEKYGGVAKTFHWVMALLMIGLLGVGLYMTGMALSPTKFQVYGLHKSFGIVVLTLAVLRLVWRLTNTHPISLPNHQTWEKILANITHVLLYVALFAMPLSGWIMSSAKGFSVSVFGLFTLPDLVGPSENIGTLANQFHEIAAWTVMALIGLHAAGALKHHVIDRDNTLRRMLPGFAFALIVATSIPAMAEEPVQNWTIQKESSSITFGGTQMGAPFTGSFKDFDGTIAFDATALGDSQANITIHLASVDATSADRTKYLAEPAWFDTAKFPNAIFKTTDISAGQDATHFIAKGDLTLRGVTIPVTLPFTLEITDNIATMNGTATLNRLEFGVGSGEWQDTSTVGGDVSVTIKLTAKKS